MDSKIYAIQNSDNREYHHQFLNKKKIWDMKQEQDEYPGLPTKDGT